MGVRIDIYAYVGIFQHARIYNCNPAFGMFVWIWGCVKYGVKCLSPCILLEYEEGKEIFLCFCCDLQFMKLMKLEVPLQIPTKGSVTIIN